MLVQDLFYYQYMIDTVLMMCDDLFIEKITLYTINPLFLDVIRHNL
jgi:hypothetical protein